MAELTFDNLADNQPQIVIDADAKRAYVLLCLPVSDLLDSISENVLVHSDPNGALNRGVLDSAIVALQSAHAGSSQSDEQIDAQVAELVARKTNRPIANSDDVVVKLMESAQAKVEESSKAEQAKQSKAREESDARAAAVTERINAARTTTLQPEPAIETPPEPVAPVSKAKVKKK